MAQDLPRYHFRTRETGAFVFRIDPEDRMRRLELDQIAVVNIRNGEVKPHGDRRLTPEDEAAIAEWMEGRRATLATRETDEIRRTVEAMHMAAHWAQSRADDAALDELTEPLLMAMHDLRNVLIRKKADRLQRDG